MRETWVGSLGWEDPLEKGKATHSSILAWRIQRTVYSVGSQSRTWLSNFHFHFSNEPKEKKSSHKIWVDPTEEEKLPKRVKLCILRVPDCAAGKESACNAGDPGLIPGSGRSAGEGIGYPLQYSWASLVAKLMKNLPAMWQTWILPLGWEDTLENGKATHSLY